MSAGGGAASREDMPAVLEKLDKIEGFRGFADDRGSLFVRRLMIVDAGDGRPRLAWVYILANGSTGTPIPSGDWKEHLGTKDDFIERIVAAHCRGREREIAERLANRIPWSMNPDRAAVQKELANLSDAVKRGILSERRLAQESELWSVEVE